MPFSLSPSEYTSTSDLFAGTFLLGLVSRRRTDSRLRSCRGDHARLVNHQSLVTFVMFTPNDTQIDPIPEMSIH